MNARIEDSGWLKHCRLLLQASVFAAEKLHADRYVLCVDVCSLLRIYCGDVYRFVYVCGYRCSVLVHCSDGWDRTAQICSLAQVRHERFHLPVYCLFHAFVVELSTLLCVVLHII